MLVPTLELMKQYNKLIESWKRAEEYFAREDIDIETKQGRATDCHILSNQIDGMITKLGEFGYQMTTEEILEGFRQVKFLEL
jgi:hypothetical protein